MKPMLSIRLSGFILAATFAATSLGAQPLTLPLTPEQVACDAQRLRGLIGIHQVEPVSLGPFPTGWTTFLSPSRADTVGLLMVSHQYRTPREGSAVEPDRYPEYHLAATLTSTMRPLLLNPERPLLEQVALVRDDTNSTLGFPDAPSRMRIEIYPAFDNVTESLLIVDLDQREGSNRPGRALTEAGLAETCHDRFTDEDRLIFSVLQRIVRPRVEDLFPFDHLGPGLAEIAIYRGAAPDVYRIDLYGAEGEGPFRAPEPVSFELTLSRDGEGRLATGALELRSSLEVAELLGEGVRDIFIVPPTFPGVEIWSETDPRTHRFAFPDDLAGGAVTIDFATLLEGSTWNPRRLPGAAPLHGL